MEEQMKELGLENEHDIVRMVMITNGLQIEFIPNRYLADIVEKYKEEIINDIYETADRDNWNGDDLRLAVSRVICRHLGIEV